MNILYGVPGEGMGHATRSKVIIEHLLRSNHDVQIVSSARAYTFLDKAFPGRVTEIKGFHFAYKNAEVSKMGTFLLNLKSAPRNLLYNYEGKLKLEKNFNTELVITDFESFSYFFARLHKLPLISIDNMQVIDRCKLEIAIAAEEKNNYRLAKGIVKAKVPGCNHYLISSFFDAPVTAKNTELVKPIIRKAIEDAPVSRGNHILMYQTSSSLKTVQEVLSKLPREQFVVYGMNKDYTDGNVTYKPFSETGFIQDLASAKAVIANGGFSFISEAVYLKKPVYSFPIANQFEQYLNAAYIDKLQYGKMSAQLNADTLKAFLYDLPLHHEQLQAYTQQGNQLLFERIDSLLQSFAR